MAKNYDLKTRQILLSTGEFTTEAVIRLDGMEFYDSAPLGLTVGLTERQSSYIDTEENCLVQINSHPDITKLDQVEFDAFISNRCDSQTSTAFSLAYLRYLAHKAGFGEKQLYQFIAQQNNKEASSPKIICNLLNGGKHSRNALAFCEFMIIPQGKDIACDVRIAAEVYSDLANVITAELGHGHLYTGREGGFSPSISDVKLAISLLDKAIKRRNKGRCLIAIDVAANNFAKTNRMGQFISTMNGRDLTTHELTDYYASLVDTFPVIAYLEDPFHENDIDGWRRMMHQFGQSMLIAADDLVVSTVSRLKELEGCFNACILKVNQAGNISELLRSHEFCVKNGIRTIISQRSGETDSNIITHMAVGLGSEFFKGGAPARERITKYNELIRIDYRRKHSLV